MSVLCGVILSGAAYMNQWLGPGHGTAGNDGDLSITAVAHQMAGGCRSASRWLRGRAKGVCGCEGAPRGS